MLSVIEAFHCIDAHAWPPHACLARDVGTSVVPMAMNKCGTTTVFTELILELECMNTAHGNYCLLILKISQCII